MAKVLIDISEEDFERMRVRTNKSSSDFIILNGIALDGLTNGEMFQKVFPNAEVDETNRGFVVLKLKATHNGEPYTDSTAIWNSIWYGKWGE